MPVRLSEHCSRHVSLPALLPEDVSDAFLIKSYKPSSSPTEHTSDGDTHGDRAHAEPAEEVLGVYLVEPIRLTMMVVKFSGTLGSTTRSDLRLLTVTAFAHYAAEQTACCYIFADIQGVFISFAHIQRLKRCSPIARLNNANTGGKLAITLFDPMTQTVEG